MFVDTLAIVCHMDFLLLVEPQNNPLAGPNTVGAPSTDTKDRLNPFNNSFHPEQTIQSFPTSSMYSQDVNYPTQSIHMQQSNYPPPSSNIYCGPPVVVPREEVIISPEQAFVRVSQGK